MKTLKEMIQTQPASSRRKIAKRIDQLIFEEMTMRELRTARKITQATLKRSVEAMGGSLTLVAEFPNSAPVKLSGFTDLTT